MSYSMVNIFLVTFISQSIYGDRFPNFANYKLSKLKKRKIQFLYDCLSYTSSRRVLKYILGTNKLSTISSHTPRPHRVLKYILGTNELSTIASHTPRPRRVLKYILGTSELSTIIIHKHRPHRVLKCIYIRN